MKKEELRIGNIVNDNDAFKEIIEIRFSNVELENKYRRDYFVNIEDLKPIELNHEWLIKFGFEKFNKDEFKLNFNGFELYFNINGIFLESIGIDIIYVHQLQNLYYILSGYELKM